MVLEIQNQCSDVFGCIRALLSTFIALAILVFSIYCLSQMYKALQRFTFEIIPLITTFLQALMQLILVFFFCDLKFLISALYFQNLTFALVTFSFVSLYFRLKYDKQKYRIAILVWFWIYIGGLIVGLFLTDTGIIKLNCNSFMDIGYFIPIIFLVLTIVVIIIYGSKLRNLVIMNQKRSVSNGLYDSLVNDSGNKNNDSGNQITDNSTQDINEFNKTIQSNENSKFFQNQASTIRFIIITCVVTGILQISSDLLREYAIRDKSFECTTENKMFEPINTGGELYMLFYQLLNLIPCTIIPYAFYYVPFLKIKGQQTIKLKGDENSDIKITQDIIIQDSQQNSKIIDNSLNFSQKIQEDPNSLMIRESSLDIYNESSKSPRKQQQKKNKSTKDTFVYMQQQNRVSGYFKETTSQIKSNKQTMDN